MLTLRIIFVFMKKYWWVFLAIAGFIIYKLVFKQPTGDIAEVLAEIQKKHEEELKAIKEADERRMKAYEENSRKLQERLTEIERQYAAAQQELDDKKRKELTKILEESHNDPDELAQRLADATGFRIILP